MKAPLLNFSLHSCLRHLLVLMPPQAVTFVGAGNGTGPLAQFFAQEQVADVTFIDAEERHLPHLKKNFGHCPGSRVVHQLVAEQTQPAIYFRANIASESGLLDPAVLGHLWPSIKVEDSETRSGTSLAELWAEDSQRMPNWLVVDCIPILSILGDCSSLKHVDVVVVRVVQMEGEASLHDSSGLVDAIELLSGHGFIHVLTEAGRHPGIGHALLVRSIRKMVSRTEDVRHAYAEVAAQLSADRRDAASARESLESRVVELIQRVRELEAEQKTTSEIELPRQIAERMAQATTKTDELKNSIEALEQVVVSQLSATNAAMERLSAQSTSEAAASIVSGIVSRLFEEHFEKQEALLAETEARQRGELGRLVQLSQRVGALEAVQKATQEAELPTQIAQHLAEGTARSAELKNSLDALEQAVVSQLSATNAAMERFSDQSASEAASSVVSGTVARLFEAHFEKQKTLLAEAEARQQGDFSRLIQLSQRVGALEAVQKATQEAELPTQIVQHLAEGTAKTAEVKNSLDALELVVTSQVNSIHAAMERLVPVEASSSAEFRALQVFDEHFEKQKALFTEIEVRQKRDLVNATSNVVKQIEAFIGIQRWLPFDDSALDFHGWPISPDLGIFLLGKIQEEKYDLIIEFGSGTSTVLFARAIALTKNDEASESFAGKRVISFEHDRVYHEKTLSLLKTRGLDEFVSLVHSPLVDHEDSGAKYLHYDCAPLLRQIAKLGEERALSILVLVDGPPELTCKNARYPAIPKIFDHLGRHRIDVVLDDANRPAEKEAIRMWKDYWKARSVRITDRQIPSEKGIYFASNMI
ncbi:hypothetical protein [Cupriavidus necator]